MILILKGIRTEIKILCYNAICFNFNSKEGGSCLKKIITLLH